MFINIESNRYECLSNSPDALLLTNSTTIVPCFFASDADFRTDAMAATALENSPNPVPIHAPSHSQVFMKFGSAFRRARTSNVLLRSPIPRFRTCLPERRPKFIVPVELGEFLFFAWPMIQWSVVKLATSKPTTMQLPKNVAKTRPRLRMPISMRPATIRETMNNAEI